MRYTIFSILLVSLLTQPVFSKEKDKVAEKGATLLEQTSQAFTRIADNAMPATVFIKTEIVESRQPHYNPFDLFGDDFSKRFFGQQFPQQQPPQQGGGGSGFLISQDGYIVTNNHVIKDASTITVTLNDGTDYPATVKGTDPRTDLAVIKIEAKNLPYLSFGDSESLKIGEWVVAIGNPFGLGSTLTVGVVSAKGRHNLGLTAYEQFIQADVPINPGNSGGPLLNLAGEVIGINTAIFTKSGGYMGIGLSIPSQMAQNVITQLLDTGFVKRGYLGVILQPVDKDLADAVQLGNQTGVLVSDVIPESPAGKGGLKAGDIVLSFNGKPVKNVSESRNEIALMNPGSELKMKVLRNKKNMDLSVVLASQDGEVLSAEFIQKIGIEIENLTPELSHRIGCSRDAQGVVITKVIPNSPAALVGLRPGFLITGVASTLDNPKEVRNSSEFETALRELGAVKHLILIVKNQNFQRYYTMRVP